MSQLSPKIWKTLIVDDEEAARSHLARLLEPYPHIQVVATAANVNEAAERFREHQPELVFLDIEMRGANGFDLLPLIHPVPKIIFVTGHEKFALKAFEVNAVDYLLKPLFARRLGLALDRILQEEPPPSAASPTPFHESDLLFLRTPQSSMALPARDILHITASGNFSHVVASEKRKLMIYRTLSQWEQRLPEKIFQRLDRSLMVNISRLEKIDSIDRNTSEIRFRGTNETLRIGRTARQRLHELLDRY